jgi:hypothetical protein
VLSDHLFATPYEEGSTEIVAPPPVLPSDSLFASWDEANSTAILSPEPPASTGVLPDSDAAPSTAALGTENGQAEAVVGEEVEAAGAVAEAVLEAGEWAAEAGPEGEMVDWKDVSDDAPQLARQQADEQSERDFEAMQLRELQDELELLNRGTGEAEAHQHVRLEGGRAADLLAGGAAGLEGSPPGVVDAPAG